MNAKVTFIAGVAVGLAVPVVYKNREKIVGFGKKQFYAAKAVLFPQKEIKVVEADVEVDVETPEV